MSSNILITILPMLLGKPVQLTQVKYIMVEKTTHIKSSYVMRFFFTHLCAYAVEMDEWDIGKSCILSENIFLKNTILNFKKATNSQETECV